MGAFGQNKHNKNKLVLKKLPKEKTHKCSVHKVKCFEANFATRSM